MHSVTVKNAEAILVQNAVAVAAGGMLVELNVFTN
jgi:hypothetical protein